MGSASLPGRHAMANAQRGELHAMGDVILQLTIGAVLILGDVSENFNNAMENVQLEVLHVGTESASVIMIPTAMGTGTIENVVMTVYPNGNLVQMRSHVLLVTTSANTPIDMEAMIDAYLSITFKEVTTSIVGTVISAHLATTNVQLTRTALVLISSLHHSYQLRHLLLAHVLPL